VARDRAVRTGGALQVVEIADRADVVEGLVLAQGDPCRVVASVLETRQTLKEERLRLPRPYVSDDAAH